MPFSRKGEIDVSMNWDVVSRARMCRMQPNRGTIDRRVLHDERLLTPSGPEGSSGTEPSSGVATDLAIDGPTIFGENSLWHM